MFNLEIIKEELLDSMVVSVQTDADGNQSIDLETVAKLINESRLTTDQEKLDAKRWNAFINSPMRLFGFAGLETDDPIKPCEKHGKNGYAHFGCDMWTTHDYDHYQPNEFRRSLLIGFADQAILCGNHNK